MKKIIALLAITILIFSCSKKEQQTSDANAPSNANAVSQSKAALKSLTSKDLQDIIGNNKGKVVLVNFFATWCPPCRKEVPELVELYKTYKGKNVEFIGIGIDDGGAEVVLPFAEKVNLNYPLFLSSQELTTAYKVDAIPATFVFDKNGKLIQSFAGYVEGQELARIIAMLDK